MNINSNTNCKVVCICNKKGGVAKTSTCLNLGASLAKLNKKVLLIDFDMQANLSMLLGTTNSKSFFDVIDSGELDITKVIVKSKHDLWLLPSNTRMALAARKYLNTDGFAYLLRDKLAPIKKLFDYIIIDTPPSGDFFMLNALMAADQALIPTQCEYLSLGGVNHIINMIKVIQARTKHMLDYSVLVTMHDDQSVGGQVILQKLKKQYDQKILEVFISRKNEVQESQIAQLPIIDYDKQSCVGRQYMELAKHVVCS